MSSKNRSLAVNIGALRLASSDIQKELANEHVDMLKDYVKGVYRLRHDYEQQLRDINTKIKEVDIVLDKFDAGDMDAVKLIKVPARFLEEKTVRLANLDWDDDSK